MDLNLLNKEINFKQSSYLKAVACLFMLIDHIGAFLIPALPILRIIGRLSMPLFAYQLTIGYIHTSNQYRYFKRLTILAFISQIPYFLLRGYQLNILFTFLFALLLIWSIDNKSIYGLLILPLIPFCSYGLYGTLTVLIFHYSKSFRESLARFSGITIFYWLILGIWQQLFAIFSFLFIYRPLSIKIISKRFFYLFYPVHLTLIYILQRILLYS